MPSSSPSPSTDLPPPSLPFSCLDMGYGKGKKKSKARRHVCWQGARTVHLESESQTDGGRDTYARVRFIPPNPVALLAGRRRRVRAPSPSPPPPGRPGSTPRFKGHRPQGAGHRPSPPRSCSGRGAPLGEATRRGGEGGIGEDAGDGGAVGGEEGEAEDGADRAPGAAGAGAVHHAHHFRRRQGARPAHHLRRLGPRQGGWPEGPDEQEADEDHDAVDAGEAEAPSHLRPRRTTQAVPLHHLVHQSQERAAEAQERSSSAAAAVQGRASQTMKDGMNNEADECSLP